MKLWKWQTGRQAKCEYKKLPLWHFRIWRWGFDAYVLKYQPDSHLPLHRDPISDGKHWRFNIGWGNSKFNICDHCPTIGWRIGKLSVYLFRPDIYLHGLSVYGKTTKLSFGFAKFY